MIIGEAVKSLRLKHGLTQQQVCERANITQGYYSTIENGAIPSLEALNKLSEVFNLPVFFLLWLATEKHDVPKHYRAWYNRLKPMMDNITDEVTTI